MKKDFGYIGNIFVFGLAGAFGLSLLFLLGTGLLAPRMFGDGQYAMSLMMVFALGWVMGAFAGAQKGARNRDVIPRGTSLLGLGIVAIGCITLPFLGVVFLMLVFNLIDVVFKSLR